MKEITGNLRNIVFNASNSQINASVNIVLANYQEGSKVVNTVTTRESFSGIQYGLRLYVDTRANTSGSVTYRVSLIEGTNISTEYSPYVANPIELCKIGDYQDKIYYDSGKWYVEKNIKKVIFNGNENWKFVATYTNTSRFKLMNFTDIKQNNTELLVMSNYFQGQTTNNRTLDIIGVAPYSTEIYIRMDKNVIATVTDFKTWLTNNNTTVYYVLATPTYTEITDTYLLDQLNGLLDIELYENLCYVDWVGIEKPTMTLQYAGTEDLGIKYIITEDGKKIRTDWRKLGRRKKWMMK